LIASGPKSAFDPAEPVLRDIGTQIYYLLPGHGTASAFKLAVNINIALIVLALAEGLSEWSRDRHKYIYENL
jgi:3-hydroxyisobutyrate dehydrogenase-like beta-hydroxyacid dehydrogenase